MRPFKGEINWGIMEQMYAEVTVILAVIKYSGSNCHQANNFHIRRTVP